MTAKILFVAALPAIRLAARAGAFSSLTLLLLGQSHALAQAAPLVIGSQTPLRVQVTRTVPLKAGARVEAKLLEAVYGPDRMLLPAGLVARGLVDATPPVDQATRMDARLNGDFTPLRQPSIRLTQLVLPTGAVLPLCAVGQMRSAVSITLTRRAPKASLAMQVKERARNQIQQMRNTVHDGLHGGEVRQNGGDRLRKMLYAQLPYHPQKLWAGSDFDAVLTRPLDVPRSAAALPSPPAPKVDLAAGTMHARLTGSVTSAAASKGDQVTAVLTEPFLDAHGRMMLPAGTPLNGVVVQAQPARWFARNGRLRFAFRSIATPAPLSQDAQPPDTPSADAQKSPASTLLANQPSGLTGAPVRRTAPPILSTRSQAAPAATPIDGHLHSIEALHEENVELDQEGGARAQPDKGRFLAPLALAVLGAASQDGDGGGSFVRQGVTSNGFGLAARVVAIAAASQNVSSGFAAYAFSKSIYRRWIARGHEVTFPQYTELSIDLGRR